MEPRDRPRAAGRGRLAGSDDGTAASDSGTIDAEDYAVLFELHRLRATALGRPPSAPRLYDAIALDEAQELAPLELALFRRSLAPNGTLVVAGDADQQTDATTEFDGWQPAMRELGCVDHAVVELDVGYRCPAGVAALARQIRSSPAVAAEAPPLPTPRPGVDPSLLRFASERELTDWLGQAIATLRRRDPNASLAIICRLPATAQRIAAALRPAIPVRLVLDGRFLPRGPAQVTVVDEVKGLEFDFVVVPDATLATTRRPGRPARALRRATRTRHQLVFAAAEAPTPLLAGLAGLAGSRAPSPHACPLGLRVRRLPSTLPPRAVAAPADLRRGHRPKGRGKAVTRSQGRHAPAAPSPHH